MTVTRPASFEIYRHVQAKLVIQVRDPATGKAVPALDLECYRAARWLDSPWYRIMIPVGSKLFLIKTTAAGMLADGKIEPHLSEVLIPRRPPPPAAKLRGPSRSRKR